MSSDPFRLVGSTIANRYAVEAVVGEGGFSVVYRARHTLWDRPVAIKVLRGGFEWLDTEARERLLRAFIQEGAILAELSERTTAIVQSRDTATLVTPTGDWAVYLVLEWLEGETLEVTLWRERQAGLPLRRVEGAIAMLEPVAQALALAHAKGICHRDLKPGNVFVLGDSRGENRTVKLLDFGMASFSRERSPAAWRDGSAQAWGFTPSYGAPEQFSPAYGPTGPWTDVFALALIVIELLIGREPMGEGSPEELAQVATDLRIRPTPRARGLHVSDAVEAVFARALALYPAERWQTVGDFWQALGAAMRPPSPQLATRRPPPRALPVAPAAALALALVLAASMTSDHPVNRAAIVGSPMVASIHP
jgi:serine/threonine protein kinase